ncbi:hypothetical protein SPRG_09519 [Saprolegnia parasitica CBS 223.65]|uniref:SGF29 C-terminal domain-containing protein n=1 Tax=Saprolegnia parasitica (strain CBS 223.65) TaxID=695850 RepID=A0A067C266_SAPPC|nr:hypothetical protein SPRG_09519 [Saprolegnia parasitica CBS 223.65]KDO24874.1 hypothetical protein SPRG_09519 [Saprolegnia parasitica CBS 223.65]|eukprot:XP_012204335.1 hypothetical protein SPRG_09519 [Saprolegnia parasitica CBS 223.65]
MAASEEAVHEIIRTQLLDNPMDSLARQLRRVYAKLEKKERAGDVSGRRRYAAKLRELLAKGVAELEFQHRQLGAAINIVELDQKAGLFESGKASSSPKAKDDAEVPTMTDIAIGAQVAARVARSHELWILASVVRQDAKTRLYEVEDEDSGDEDTEGKRHHLVPRDWMIPLPREEEVHNWISFKWNQKSSPCTRVRRAFTQPSLSFPTHQARCTWSYALTMTLTKSATAPSARCPFDS